MQWDEQELGTQFTPNVFFWTPNSEILAKALGEGTCAYYCLVIVVGFTRIAVNFKFHSWFANFKLT